VDGGDGVDILRGIAVEGYEEIKPIESSGCGKRSITR